MGILLWIIFGALVGWVASIIMKTNDQQGAFGDILLGIVGAVVGGFIMNLLGQPGVNEFNLYSFIVALIGAVIVVTVSRAFRSRV
ncbi:GlsB/YeaQ/YmgE family stress response membrane protein [candidate division WWE3 bacterium]|nr:GlsB/YeaQ/YmgE family stress response membrane protein [candidate division WWE3 bacterium]